jgi:hypothetical protein
MYGMFRLFSVSVSLRYSSPTFSSSLKKGTTTLRCEASRRGGLIEGRLLWLPAKRAHYSVTGVSS